tara:strand:- start:168 stop:452 length:285 start_codon:yes stop_codon:yes gene_type:complete
MSQVQQTRLQDVRSERAALRLKLAVRTNYPKLEKLLQAIKWPATWYDRSMSVVLSKVSINTGRLIVSRTRVTEFGNMGGSGEGEVLSYASLQEI